MIRTLVFLSLAVTAFAKPNLIFILSDDIAQGDVGCYGQKLIQTPALDRMAAEGTRYLQGYCGTSVCAPSRSSLMTGLHSGHCPIRANREIQPEGRERRFRGGSKGSETGAGALRTMSLYIDLNPVRAGMVKDAAAYEWSGFGDATRGVRRAQRGLSRTPRLEAAHPPPLQFQGSAALARYLFVIQGR